MQCSKNVSTKHTKMLTFAVHCKAFMLKINKRYTRYKAFNECRLFQSSWPSSRGLGWTRKCYQGKGVSYLHALKSDFQWYILCFYRSAATKLSILCLHHKTVLLLSDVILNKMSQIINGPVSQIFHKKHYSNLIFYVVFWCFKQQQIYCKGMHMVKYH